MTTLEVTHDGTRATATVVRNGHAAFLDDVIEATQQPDEELAGEYRNILARVAPRLYLVVEREFDGSRDNGCSWLAVRLTDGINGDALTGRAHRLTRTEFRGWHPTEEQVRAETVAVLRAAVRLGLGQAQHWRGAARTVAECLARIA